jgi:hypothetical protein
MNGANAILCCLKKNKATRDPGERLLAVLADR